MQRFHSLRAGVLALATLALVSCEQGAVSPADSSGFRAQYFAARDALEAGKYDRASRTYLRLLTRAGPLEPRIRLEYAHSLLRGEKYAEAAREARILARSQNGTARAAALAVQATAEHELGLAAIDAGDRNTGRSLLQQADSAISEVLGSDPALDPLGALAGRQASIRVRLKSQD
ncbi:hypothetical protein [Puniceibacterium sp. IMCC21224]|uniref:hypothetical protein n=1 Tax=Puniceibacterium sp. IMCC21224 TaxID=1618204 RepID=UPI00064DBE20|nr:hypothetical protein [Puniceibacterium sp. IMCC21224]KMK64010.1 Tetratricopeptide repeat [Puniceibacterium sp. IMCC21224]